MGMMGVESFVEIDRVIVRINIPSGFSIGSDDSDDDYVDFIADVEDGDPFLLDHDSVGMNLVYLTFSPEGGNLEEIRKFCADVLSRHLTEKED